MTSPAPHYRARREALSALVEGLAPEERLTRVPGCPEWTVHDVVAHLTGVTADVCSGTMDGAGGPAWTQAQVDARAQRSTEEVLTEWTKRSVGFEEQLPAMGFLGWVFTFDVTLHADDVREALGLPLPEDDTAWVVLEGLLGRAGKRAEGRGRLEVRVADRVLSVGEGDTTTVTIPTVGEALRAVGDRRTDEQLRAYAWEGDPEPWVAALPLFRGR